MDKQEFQIKRYKPKLFRQLMEANCGCDVEKRMKMVNGFNLLKRLSGFYYILER